MRARYELVGFTVRDIRQSVLESHLKHRSHSLSLSFHEFSRYSCSWVFSSLIARQNHLGN